ncbi:MAG: RagB/SusD family nutrient uptake outer membrane protein [Pedobacter sp.]|nr:RagB/SusD family nutrient uptake outer membrane protein [Pedobacter sp.]
MKNFKSIIYCISLLALLPLGCSKMLDEQPESFLSPDSFFATEAQCIQAVNGAYSGLPTLFGQEDLWKSLEVGTDLMISTAPTEIHQDYSFSAGNAGSVQGIWRKCYDAINNANLCVTKIEKAPIGTAIKNRLVGEAKYLRAMHYFFLTNTFGDVPMWTGEFDFTKISTLPRSSVAAVRAQMKADLLDASNVLPPSYGAADVGRATKGAALGLLAKVYLFDKDWANAQKYAQMVVDGNQYQLVAFANLFDVFNKFKNNKESIFEIQYSRNNATNVNTKIHYYHTWFLPLKDANGTTYAGVNFGNTVMRAFEVLYPSAPLVNMFEAGDLRKNVTLATGYNTTTFNRFPKPGRPWFGAKFWDLESNDQSSGKDIYFMRYADVLLILAEALNEQNNPTALTWINKVRLEHGGLTTPLSGLDQNGIRDVIMRERAIEFVGEFGRKWDLFRWRKIVDAVKSVAADNPLGAANVRDFHNLFPIPQAEILKNPNLNPQNTGY